MATSFAQQGDQKLQKRTQATPRRISWEAFQRKYLNKEDSFKYEWVDGIVEKTRRTMDYTQFHIAQNLLEAFYQLQSTGKVDGALIMEGDVFFGSKHRRPDLAYFTTRQIQQAADGVNPVPAFLIEVISNNDAINRIQTKMQDYRDAEVQVVWHIFPVTGEVNVYGGEDLRYMVVCSGDMICSAAPVVPELRLTVADILKKSR